MAGSGAQAVLLHFDPVCAEFKLSMRELFFYRCATENASEKVTFSAMTEIWCSISDELRPVEAEAEAL